MNRGDVIPVLDLDPELEFQLFGDSGSRFGSSKKWNRNTFRGVLILGLDPDTESDFLPFGNSESGFGSSKKWNRNTST